MIAHKHNTQVPIMFYQRKDPIAEQTAYTPPRRHQTNTFVTTYYYIMFVNSPSEKEKEDP